MHTGRTPALNSAVLTLLGILAGVSLAAAPASAQDQPCPFLCPPAFSVSPSVFVTRAFDTPEVRLLPAGGRGELEQQTEFILFLNLLVPTTVPRTNLSLQLGWAPYAERAANPFTGFTAADLAEEQVDANEPTLDLGVNVDLVRRKEDTQGWVGLTFEVLDQFGPAQQPGDARTYEHNLDFELDASFGLFNWLEGDGYLKNVTAFAELDYLATGLAEAGDEVPNGERVFEEDDSPWTFIAGLTLPVAPLVPGP
ncbi:MAG: hypothetical protein H0V09_09090 [Gemmatimonadetes bacterium]|nr:hypothetical protein [Gemmatimonadota bacterium]